jgi:heme-degrading monooxygenase HmoA
MNHIRIATYDVTKGTAPEIADTAKGGLLPIFQDAAGFQAYAVIEVDPKKVVSLSVWKSHQEAEDAVKLAADWVASELADRVKLTSNTVGDALFWVSSAT